MLAKLGKIFVSDNNEHVSHVVENHRKRRLGSPDTFRMFGGYTDVLQYNFDPEITNGQVDEDFPNCGPLPREYVPQYNPPDPWHKPASCQQDFILIAEFSEQEGPKPLITIPKDAGGNFDLNNFSVRIMSVDYQNMASSGFSVQEDTQIVVSESSDGMYAYVHRFTLYDSQGRGFVRPFCMAYVTPDHKKLMSFYEDISSEFLRVSQFFKFGNLRLFQKDMTHYHTDLQYTKARYIERQEELQDSDTSETPGSPAKSNLSHEDKIFRSMNLKTLSSCLTEVRDILERASDLMSQQSDHPCMDQLQHFENQASERTSSTSHGRTESANKQEVLLSSSFHSESPDNSVMVMRQRSSSLSEVDGSSVFDDDEYKPKLVRTINRRRFDKALRSIHELCHWGAKEGIKMLSNIHKYYSRDLACLEMERNDKDLIDPAVGLLTVGRNVTTNFLCRTCVPRTGLSPVDGLYSANAWLSSDTIGSYKSAESFLSAKEEIEEPTVVLRSSALDDGNSFGSYDLISSTSSMDEAEQPSSQVSPSRKINQTRKNEKLSSVNNSPSTRNFSPDIAGELSSASISTRSSSIESSAKHSTVTVISTADHISSLSPTSPGHGILHLMQQYPFTVHMLFSLLSGRLLIVTGGVKFEKEIHSTINALRLFVPGHSNERHNIVGNVTKPLRITDLAQLKLIGHCKTSKRPGDHFLPACVKKYVSILDVEKKLLSSPPYKGTILKDLFEKRKHFKCEKAFVAYIHSIVSDLAAKAQLYFHMTCLKHSKPISLTEEEIFVKLKVAASDVEIVKYFVRVVEHQQFEDIYSEQGADNGFSAVVDVRLNYTKCSLFKA